MMEEWRPVVGFEGAYEVSNLGKVRSNTRMVIGNCGSLWLRKGRIRKIYTNDKGYRNVVLYHDGVMKRCSVHRLVAQAFIPNPLNLPYINHKDENPSNNIVFINPDGSINIPKSNLEWCTAQYNSNYGSAIEKRIKNTQIPVGMYDDEGNMIRSFNSASEAGRVMNCDNSAILKCCKGQKVHVAKYKWKFI